MSRRNQGKQQDDINQELFDIVHQKLHYFCNKMKIVCYRQKYHAPLPRHDYYFG